MSSAITIGESKTPKKERCKFYPSCGKGERCEYVHPSSPCKTFPNCKFGDSCLYIHPKCKFDLTCSRLNCNYTHTPVSSAAPPLCKSFLSNTRCAVLCLAFYLSQNLHNANYNSMTVQIISFVWFLISSLLTLLTAARQFQNSLFFYFVLLI